VHSQAQRGGGERGGSGADGSGSNSGCAVAERDGLHSAARRTKKILPEGAEIVVDGYQSKDGALRANGHDITSAEGKKLFVGSSAPVGSSEPPAK